MRTIYDTPLSHAESERVRGVPLLDTKPKRGLVRASATALGALIVASMAIVSVANAQTEPVISAVTATPTTSGATITWTTDENANSQVAYGTTVPYTATTTLDTSQVTSHSEPLSGLSPSTTYHYEVISTDATGSTMMSPDATFMTSASSTTGSTSTAPVISSVVATPSMNGATFTWTTDQNANSQVVYGLTSSYTGSTTLDTSSVMSHSELASGLSPSTTYHYAVESSNGSGMFTMSPDATFTTLGSSTSSTSIQDQITMLENEIATIEQEITTLFANQGQGGGGTGTTTPPVNSGPPSIDQNGETTSSNSVDFGGRNFDHEEQVTVTLNGTTVGTAHADDGGNFSTGSMSLPTTPGTYTYTFSGSKGDSATATVTVQ